MASFGRDTGRVFGFDVKATDKRGAENGRSSIANVFVSLALSLSLVLWYRVPSDSLNYPSLEFEVRQKLISPKKTGFPCLELFKTHLSLAALSNRMVCSKVYVLDDQKQVVMVVGRRPIDIEPQLENITS